MKNIAPPATRLTELREAWPEVSWQEVREADPRAFRNATTGALLVIPAVMCTFLMLAFFLDQSFPLPTWLEPVRRLVMVVLLFGAIMLWVSVIVLLGMPAVARRTIAMQKFAQARGYRFAKFGFDVEPLGIYFAEQGYAVV